MQCFTELIAPTAVTHAVTQPFLASNTSHLLVAKTSLLQVFSVKKTPNGGQSKLALVGEYPLSGTVTGLASISIPNTKSGGDALLVAFRDAKLSLIEWDPENHRISTISIHYYEGEGIIHQPFGPSPTDCPVILTVDPSSRCAALKFGARHLAILPFRQLGDDLAEADDGDVDMETVELLAKRAQSQPVGGEEATKETPYKPSFVLPLTILDPALVHMIDLTFLDEYREPTFGFLSSSLQPSTALLADRKDCQSYTVLTLDLDQRASTNLVTVPNLPSDLWKIVPLALPVGGALLIGDNEFIHVDQSGKTTAVAVNDFAHQTSKFNMVDHSHLNMKLEHCEVTVLDPLTGDLLVVLPDGALATLAFKLLGRNVGGIVVTRVAAERGGGLNQSAPSALASMPSNNLFIGSEDGESVLLTWTKQGSALNRKRSYAQMTAEDAPNDESADVDEIDEDEDDLYATTAHTVRRSASPMQGIFDSTAAYSFERHDAMQSLGPINSLCLGKSQFQSKDKLQLVAATGRSTASRIVSLNRDIIPSTGRSTPFIDAKNAWALHAPARDGSEDTNTQANEYDNLLFVFDGESTKVFDVSELEPEDVIYRERTDTEFEHDGETLTVVALADSKTIVQCRRTEVRTYNSQLDLSSIIPMYAEDGETELRILATSFWNQYLLVLREDSSVQILKFDSDGDAEPLVEEDSAVAERKWLSGCIHSNLVLEEEPSAYLLGQDGGLYIFSLPELKLCYQAPSLIQLPPVLSAEIPLRRGGGKTTLTELLMTNIGDDNHCQSYLTVRSSMDDLTLYEPFRYGAAAHASSADFSTLRFRKVPCQHLPKYDETLQDDGKDQIAVLQPIRIGGYSVVYIPGVAPSMVIKDAQNLPKIISIQAEKVKAITMLNLSRCENGFAFLNTDGVLSEHILPAETWYGTGWSVKSVTVGDPAEEIREVAFHEERHVYVVATCRNVDFFFLEDDGRHPEQDELTLRPQIPQYTLHLLSARTHSVLNSLEMPYTEQVTSLKVMKLESSEHTHEQKLFVVVGTGAQRGEDMPAKGAVTVFDIIDVVPEPEWPETGIKLHVFAREETKGAVTAVESFPGGLVGIVQGQKVMIRGLKEDGSCLPVAFLDALCDMTTLKAFGSSGLWLLGDVWKGLWFGGFTQEPYKMTALGKSQTQMEVMVAQFLPFDQQLYIVIIDGDTNLHVLQYDPENPKSMSGTRLLERSAFHLGHFPTTLTLIPSGLRPFAQQDLSNGHFDPSGAEGSETQSFYQVLTTTQTGSIGLITPLDETTYRRFGALQTQLSTILEHAAGLNPRAYRAVPDAEGTGARVGVIDGNLIQRISELGSLRRNEVLGRAGGDVWELRSDLEIIGGGGLRYL